MPQQMKKGLRKTLSWLLTVTLIVSMLPLAVMADGAPAFEDGYPKPGEPQAVGSRQIQVKVQGILPVGETSMGVSYVLLSDNDPAPTAQQIKNSYGKLPGVTVITYGTQTAGSSEATLSIIGKQSNTDYDLYVVFWAGDSFSEVRHLDVKTPAAAPENPDPPMLASPTNLRWDAAEGLKAKWDAVDGATSYVVTLYKNSQSTMIVQFPAITGTEINVQSNISGRTGDYFFTVQAKADEISSLSPASPLHNYVANLGGTATISNMNPKVGDTLTGSLAGGNNTGNLSYTWKADGTPVGENINQYTVTEADVGKIITLEISSDVELGTRTSAPTTAVSAAPITCIAPDCPNPQGEGAFGDFTRIGDEQYYHVSAPAQLAHIDDHRSLNYLQTADINLSQYNEGVWTPIAQSGQEFTGKYLGNGKKITRLTLDLKGTDESDLFGGLFGKLGIAAHIEGIDLTIEELSAEISESSSGTLYLGGIAAVHESPTTIEDCHVTFTGDVNARNTAPFGDVYFGGIVGRNSGLITGCSTDTSNMGDVSIEANMAYVGGIAGRTDASITHSDHTGRLHVEAADDSYTNRLYVGGIAGYAVDGRSETKIENCQNSGDIESINNCDDDAGYRAYAGGIVGHLDWNGHPVAVQNCANIGSDHRVYTKAPTTMTGGIAGSGRFIMETGIRITNCYNRSSVVSLMVEYGKDAAVQEAGSDLCTGVTAGGIIGAAGGIQVQSSYSAASDIDAAAQPYGDHYAGGIAGLIWDTEFAENYYESNENVSVGVGGSVTPGAAYFGLPSDQKASLASVPSWKILPRDDVKGEVQGATATQLKTKSFFGTEWKWYIGGGSAPDYYDALFPWRFTSANSYPVLRGLPYKAPATPSGGSSSTYKITATANHGGTITPAGTSTVSENRSLTYNISPDQNFLIEDVLVDGTSVGAVSQYTFTSVRADHTIQAVFAHDCPSKPYTDVDITKWYHESIDYVLRAGLFYGTTATKFEPDSAMTRGMLVTVLHRLEGKSVANSANPFTDVAPGAWYTDAVAWASENGIVKGYDAKTYGPEDPITREQMAAILHRYARFKGLDLSIGENTNILSYEDALDISEYAVAAMQWACGIGIIQGDGAKLNPRGNATRAEVAAMLMRLIEQVLK